MFDDLARLMTELEASASQGIDALLRDPATLEAAGQAGSLWTAGLQSLPDFGLRHPTPAVGTVERGLEEGYPHGLLQATRTGWASAVSGLLPTLLARGANPALVGPELAALQGALASTPAPELAPTPRELVWTRGCARLWRLRAGEGVPTIVVASLVNRFYLLDLLQGQSLVERLEGPLYLLDWSVGREGLDEVLALVDEALARFGRVKLFGYSMGGTLGTVHAARHPEQVERLAVFGAPIDTERGGKFRRWTEHADFEAFASVAVAVPAAWVHTPFWALRPTVNLAKLARLVSGWRRPGTLERFLAVELWNNDNVDFSAALYSQWGQRLYRDNALWSGELAELEAIACPVLALAAEGDGIVPHACTTALAEKAPQATAHLLPSGHVGALSGRRGLDATAKALREFLA